MKKVVNVSVGGRAFSLDEDAYARLQAYFDHFKARLGQDPGQPKEEVMSDLENRIAELFEQGTGGSPCRVVSLSLVENVVGRLGMPDGSAEPTTEDSGASEKGTRTDGGSSAPGQEAWYAPKNSVRKLYRDPDNKAVGGVCAGLAAYLGVDLVIVRVASLLSLLLWGAGVIVYLVLWIMVPLASTPADKCMMRGMEPTAENMSKFSQGRSGYGK